MPESASFPFHLSLHVHDLTLAEAFYVDCLGAQRGRSAASWIDFDLFGHQLSLHLGEPSPTTLTGEVDGVPVPMPHFGVILDPSRWQKVAQRLQAHNTRFIVAPHLRFPNTQAAQWTLFCTDPSGNALEFKAFETPQGLFG